MASGRILCYPQKDVWLLRSFRWAGFLLGDLHRICRRGLLEAPVLEGFTMSKSSIVWSVAGLVMTFAVGLMPVRAEEGENMAAIEKGSVVEMDYTLTVEGQKVDSSEGRGPLKYVHGQNQIVPGLEQALTGMSPGDSKHVTVAPEGGYGPVQQEAIIEVPREQLPSDLDPQVGQALQGQDREGNPFRAVVDQVGENTVTLDLNHPLAGKTLEFDVDIVSVNPADAAQ